ncbi:MAG: hypothetical protein A3G34_15545 [Candidatus Lindowbacteria bacterium RIFCSPLOWO2_12_FULL_62_27]|nr:MAG: hypothetical protein A3I06_09875 [Candidatus Lindowbacteria bacterium RIFCSPLOWO2_02_FULL_62_12]OGH63265.1 MAG: hypothetical protein A3G34_15545 [Candidatus Lindowbacteria bacterium RIFCSPLOWO2_12_FULL_62_27]
MERFEGNTGSAARRWGWVGICVGVMALPALGVEQTKSTTIDKPNVAAARTSYDINRNVGQTTYLDRQISGLSFAPNGFSSTKAQRGMTLDMYYTLVTGSLLGSRRGIGSEFADPILSQIASIQGKWTLLREGPLWPAMAGGVDLNLDFNWRGGFPFSKYRVLTYPSFIAFSKTIYPRTGTFLTVGRYSSLQMEHLAYLTRFLDPKATSVPFAGMDFKVKDPSKGFRMEIFAPAAHIDGAKVMNIYIKALAAMPMTLISYARSDAGRAVVLSFSFRYAFFPSLTREERYKKRWWNPLSWYQDDNKNMAARLAQQADTFLARKEYEKARKKYQESLFLNANVPEVHYNMATTALQIGGPEEVARAIFHYNRAIELGGADAAKLYALGLAYFKVGEKDHAQKVFSDALIFDPEYKPAKYALDRLNGGKS